MLKQISIYPTIIYNRFRALDIDNRIWLGVESAIINYLKYNGIKINEVQWIVDDRHTFVATDINDFKNKFYRVKEDWA